MRLVRLLLGCNCAAQALLTFASPVRAEPARCSSDERCGAESSCAQGTCKPRSSVGSPWWIGPATQMDTALMVGGDVCGRESQSAVDYACFRNDEEQYVGTPDPRDAVSTTLAYGTTRFLLHAERSILSDLSAGGRLGVAVGGGPSPANGRAFMPLHMEAHVAYWFLGGLDSSRRLSVFGSALGGIAQIDASRRVAVRECDEGTPACAPAQNVQPGGSNPDRQELDAYVKLGLGFAGTGLGLFYKTFEGSGILANLRIIETFPTSGTVFSLSLAYVFRGP